MTGTAVSFGTLDWVIVALYFVANTAICIWAALKKEKDTADYFLASRSAGWFLIGSSHTKLVAHVAREPRSADRRNARQAHEVCLAIWRR